MLQRRLQARLDQERAKSLSNVFVSNGETTRDTYRFGECLSVPRHTALQENGLAGLVDLVMGELCFSFEIGTKTYTRRFLFPLGFSVSFWTCIDFLSCSRLDVPFALSVCFRKVTCDALFPFEEAVGVTCSCSILFFASFSCI